MTRLSAIPLLPRTAPVRGALASTVAALALTAPLAPSLAAQQQPGTFSLPPSTPSPTPAPAGPADERAGVAIPPRAVTTPIEAEPRQQAPAPAASPSTAPSPRASTGAPSPAPASPRPQSAPQNAPVPGATGAVLPQADAAAPPSDALPALPTLPEAAEVADPVPVPGAPSEALGESILPEWWPWAAGGAGGLALLGGAALFARRRRRRRPLRLAAPPAKPAAPGAPSAADAETDRPRLDLALEITAATRSVMMFTLEYRLTIANRSDRAVNGLSVALQLACARASAGAGSAQSLTEVARIGPHQAQSLTGTLQLPLSAITPLRQGTTPLFVPLVHVTLEGEGQRAHARSFVIGPPSASGRVHPIPLDVPPGSITGLKAQAIAVPAVSAAA